MAVDDNKREFLVAYDYGTGGLWGILYARSKEEIAKLYPELIVIDERPKWMTEGELDRIRELESHDTDGAPWGMLNAVLADRHQRS
jgi:hypothetical protein